MVKEYQVLAIDEVTRLDDLRGVKQVYRYSVKSAGGVRFSIEIDDPDPTAEQVAPLLADKAAKLDKILKLGG